MNLCCNQELRKKVMHDGIGLDCTICGKKGKGADEYKAYQLLLKSKPTQTPQILQAAPPMIRPVNAEQLPMYIAQNMQLIRDTAAPFVSRNKDAFTRMIKKNIRGVLLATAKAPEVWKTPEGQASVIEALEDACSLGAIINETGYIVPFKNTVQFIPKKEAYEFALTHGKDAPLEWIEVTALYENDKYSMGNTKEEGFYFSLDEYGNPERGKVIQIIVQGYLKKRKRVIGEPFDVPRLLAKAQKHSRQPDAYTGPNAVEMLCKMAMKSYFSPMVKMRGSEAAFNDIQGDDIDAILDKSINDLDIVDHAGGINEH